MDKDWSYTVASCMTVTANRLPGYTADIWHTASSAFPISRVFVAYSHVDLNEKVVCKLPPIHRTILVHL